MFRKFEDMKTKILGWGWLFLALTLSGCGAKRHTTGPLAAGTNYPITHAPSTGNSSINASASFIDRYASTLEVNSGVINSNVELYYFIDDWLGSPHRYGGNLKSGIDCSGFIHILFSNIYSINLPRTSRDMATQVHRKKERQLREGDLVFFSFGGRNIDHVGMYLHNGKFVHVSTSNGVIISNLKEQWYHKYFKFGGQIKY